MKNNEFAVIISPSFPKLNDVKANIKALMDFNNLNTVINDFKAQGIDKIILLCANSDELNKAMTNAKNMVEGIDLATNKQALGFYLNQVSRYIDAKLSVDQIITNLKMSVANTVNL